MAGIKIGELASPIPEELDPGRLRRSLASDSTVVAKADEPAIEVAERLGEAEGRLVVVVDDSGEPIGVVDPDQVRREVAAEPSLERLGSLRHRLYWCAAGDHYVNRLPCPEHG
jgi:hypothetical protein